MVKAKKKKRRKRRKPSKARAGIRILRLFLILERLGDVSHPFRYSEICNDYGYSWTDMVLMCWIRNGAIIRLERGRYKLDSEYARRAKAWLVGELEFEFRIKRQCKLTSEKLRLLVAKERAEKFQKDEEELEKAAEMAHLGSACLAIRERLDEEARLRKTQLGRIILALRASGREMSRPELESALGAPLADIVVWEAVNKGRLIRTRIGFYDLPSRAKAPLTKNNNEAMLLVLAAMGVASVSDVAHATGVHRSIIHANCSKRLRRQGKVERLDEGKYRLTPEGWAAVEAILKRNSEAAS